MQVASLKYSLVSYSQTNLLFRLATYRPHFDRILYNFIITASNTIWKNYHKSNSHSINLFSVRCKMEKLKFPADRDEAKKKEVFKVIPGPYWDYFLSPRKGCGERTCCHSKAQFFLDETRLQWHRCWLRNFLSERGENDITIILLV